jgi:hypothetical protein
MAELQIHLAKLPYAGIYKSGFKAEPCEDLFVKAIRKATENGYEDLLLLTQFERNSYVITGGFVLFLLDYTTSFGDIDVFIIRHKKNEEILKRNRYTLTFKRWGLPAWRKDGSNIEFIQLDPVEKIDDIFTLLHMVSSFDFNFCMHALTDTMLFHVARPAQLYDQMTVQADMKEETIRKGFDRLRKYQKRIAKNEKGEELLQHIFAERKNLITVATQENILFDI